MHSKQFKILGYEVTMSVPESVDEYNALAPKRENPVLEDAIYNVAFRGMHPQVRDNFVEEIETLTGVERINKGDEKHPKWESEVTYHDRALASFIKSSGRTESDIKAEWLTIIQKHASAVVFDPAVREGTGEGPKISKTDLKIATELVEAPPQSAKDRAAAAGFDSPAAWCAAMLGKFLNRAVETDVKSLARALGDKRREQAKALEQKTREEAGLA